MRAGLQIVGMPLKNRTGQSLGQVADVLFDDDCRRVIGLVLARPSILPRTLVIPFDDLHAFRDDAIIAASTRAPFSGGPATKVDACVQGKIAVSRTGRYLGRVRDVHFDERTGTVQAYEVTTSESDGGRLLIPVTAVPGVNDVLVVRDGDDVSHPS